MNWFYLIVAAIFEISWAVGLKYSVGLTKLYPSIFTVAAMLLSFLFLSLAAKNLPIGTAYAIWTGIGAAGTALYGMIFFGEPKDLIRIFCVFLIVAGVIGLRLTYTQN